MNSRTIGESSSSRARRSTGSMFPSSEDLPDGMGVDLDEAIIAAVGGSGSDRRLRRSSTSEPVLSRRGRPRRARGDAGRAQGELEAEEGAEEEAAEGAGEAARADRVAWPHGPRLRRDFARDWEGSQLVLAPESHLSQRVLRGWDPGTMCTFSRYTSVFWAYERALSDRSRALLEASDFGPLISSWYQVAAMLKPPRAHLVVLRAFLDRFWDTTSSFHMPGYEAGVTLTDFAMMSSLPCGSVPLEFECPLLTLEDPVVLRAIGTGLLVEKENERATSLPKTCHILDYFQGRGNFPPSEGEDGQNARLWLWWFLSAVYFGEKGERASTQLLPFLMDWTAMGAYDWISPALGLTIMYLRDAVRPDQIARGSKPSLVFPGFIMESWAFSHFPALLPEGFVAPNTYPGATAWASCDRSLLDFSYDDVQRMLNAMTYDQSWAFSHFPALLGS
ncbi:hypothetical protein RND81_06G108200 [Saponaria officinalis]|uniref:Aminotransferase-like plant mobile domain-containing protein n=1 Tax=Saponaria officinalis TaxID=3572 RepID=A0AAW1KC63_SAPOF